MILSIWKHANSTAEFPFPYSPLDKNSSFNVLKHIFWYDNDDNSGNSYTAGIEVMKPIFLMVFTRRESFNLLSTLFKMGGGVSAKRLPASFPQHFLLLVLIIFPHSCKTSGP